MSANELTPLITLIGIQTTIILAALGFMWNRMDKRFDRLENKIDVLFEKFADLDKRTAILEKTR